MKKKTGLVKLINDLCDTGRIRQSTLNLNFTGFKAIPENGKRWKKNEEPKIAEVKYIDEFEIALDMARGNNSEFVHFIVTVPRKDLEEWSEKNK